MGLPPLNTEASSSRDAIDEPYARCWCRLGWCVPFLPPNYFRWPAFGHGHRSLAHVSLVAGFGQHHLAPRYAEECVFPRVDPSHVPKRKRRRRCQRPRRPFITRKALPHGHLPVAGKAIILIGIIRLTSTQHP